MGFMYILGKVNSLHGDTVTLYARNSKQNFKNSQLIARGSFSVNQEFIIKNYPRFLFPPPDLLFSIFSQ